VVPAIPPGSREYDKGSTLVFVRLSVAIVACNLNTTHHIRIIFFA